MRTALAAIVAAAFAIFPAAAAPAASFQARAEGFQVYECSPREDDGYLFHWVPTASFATLKDAHNHTIGRYQGGGRWEAEDGTHVTGELIERKEAGRENLPGATFKVHPAAKGLFEGVTKIRRVDTLGGGAPHGGCDGARAGREVRVQYSADVLFYRKGAR